VTPIEWPVGTRRLSLRAYTPDDLDALWAFEQLPQVQHWLGWAPHTREELRDAMDAESSSTTHVMVLLASTIIGHIMIIPRDSWAQMDVAIQAKGLEAELGWMFNPAYGGQGYATEAVRASIELCFDKLGLRRIHAGQHRILASHGTAGVAPRRTQPFHRTPSRWHLARQLHLRVAPRRMAPAH
jgi:RimJ/RimL family protein N-acetyltransferase